MNLLNILTGFYSKLHDYPGVPFWVLTPFRRFSRGLANKYLPEYLELLYEKRKKSNSIALPKSIIVSLTSFPARIDSVWQVVECMLNQTIQSKNIFLWLSKEQFPTDDSIPSRLRLLENDIFKIRMVDGDIRSHKKYYYAAIENPDELIFLIDDDIYYPTDILERSYLSYLQHPNCVICNYGYRIVSDSAGRHKSYAEWKLINYGAEGKNLFFGSGGGTLFKTSMMHEDLTNISKAIDLTPFADDIWLNAMTKLAGTEIVMLPANGLLPVKSDSESLSSTNNGQSQNDVQLSNIENNYGRCFDKITI